MSTKPKPPTCGQSSFVQATGPATRGSGQFYNLHNDYQKAGDYYERALMLSPDNARVLFSLGLVFTNRGQYDRGIEFLERAIQLSAYQSRPTTIWASRISERDVIATPWAHWKGSFQCPEPTKQPATWRGFYWLTGRKDEARQKYEFGIRDGEERLQMNPRDHAIHVLVGRYYAMLGQEVRLVAASRPGLAAASRRCPLSDDCGHFPCRARRPEQGVEPDGSGRAARIHRRPVPGRAPIGCAQDRTKIHSSYVGQSSKAIARSTRRECEHAEPDDDHDQADNANDHQDKSSRRNITGGPSRRPISTKTQDGFSA